MDSGRGRESFVSAPPPAVLLPLKSLGELLVQKQELLVNELLVGEQHFHVLLQHCDLVFGELVNQGVEKFFFSFRFWPGSGRSREAERERRAGEWKPFFFRNFSQEFFEFNEALKVELVGECGFFRVQE